MTVTIPSELEEAVKTSADIQGLSVESWVGQLLARELHHASTPVRDEAERQRRRNQTIAELDALCREITPRSAPDTPQEGIVEEMRKLRARVKPDPEGWTLRDYVEHGRR